MNKEKSKKYLSMSVRTPEDLCAVMDEAILAMGVEKADENEFGEKVAVLPSKYAICQEINDICQSITHNPFNKNPQVDSISVDKVEEVDDGDHYVATFFGGANGGGGDDKLQTYLLIIRKLVAGMSERLEGEVWLVDWKNDCADDVWSLRLGFRVGDKFLKV